MLEGLQKQALLRGLSSLGAARLALLAVVAILVTATVALASYYMSRPDLHTLYGGLSTQDLGRIAAALKDAGISFDVNAEGNKVMVRPEQTAHARMLLAEKGLPSSPNTGYEIFDKLGPMSLSSFMQEVTRVRVLEGEIARTIQAMRGIKAARVHLVLPEAGSFRRNKQTPSASVVVRTESMAENISGAAIRHLVASAVPGMGVDQVTVLNTNGVVLASAGDSASPMPSRMLELERTLGRELQESIRRTLVPYLGFENFEVSVSARLNIDRRQTSETTFDPESRVERSVRAVKEAGNTQSTAKSGVVSVEQNLPGEQAGSAAGELSRKASEKKDETTNYELNSRSVATTSEGYRIEGLSVAVVLNRKRLMGASGGGAAASGDDLERSLKEIERVVASAAGLDAKRGDRVTVTAVDFLQPGQVLEPVAAPSVAEILARQAGSAIRALTLLAATAMLIWLGLKPLSRQLIDSARAPVTALAAPPAVLDGLGDEADRPRAGASKQPPLAAALPDSAQSKSPQQRLEEIVTVGEERAALVLKQLLRAA